MATYWVPDLADIKGFAGHHWHSVLKFANGATSAWSNKHINMLGWVCGLGKCFLSLKSPKTMKSHWGDWKRVSYHGNQFLYSRRGVACRTISLLSLNGLCCKLMELGLFIYLMLYWVEWMTSSVLSFAYFTRFSSLNISGSNEDISKR